jgi:16S rRNA (uracil1498-N3)-methyltransferase
MINVAIYKVDCTIQIELYLNYVFLSCCPTLFMYIFYHTNLNSSSVVLEEEESKHCVKVLRMREHDLVYLADGKGTQAKGVITDANPKKCEIQITERIAHPLPFNYRLHMYVAPTKNTDRMEWFLEKAVECGINAVTFIITENSERRQLNLDRMHKIILSAMKQSKQWHLPVLNPVISWNEMLRTQFGSGSGFIAWCNAPNTNHLASLIDGAAKKGISEFHILIGPEGDFTDKEVEQAKENGLMPVSLGPTILRTETAALFGVMSVKALLNK